MAAKKVLINTVVEIESTSGSGTYEDYSTVFSEASLPFDRAMVESGTFGNASQEETPGIFDLVATLNLRPDADGLLYAKLLTWFSDGVERGIKLKEKTGSIAPGNLQSRCTRAVLKNLPFGGARGALANEGQITIRLNGGVTVDNGTTTVGVGT
jgi:hypothetical protein